MEVLDRGLRWVWIAAGLVGMVLVLGLVDLGRPAEPAAALLGAWETDPAVWGRSFPRQYHSWMQARGPAAEDIGYGPGRTKWGGSRRREPLGLFAGLGFAEAGRAPQEPPRHPVGCQGCHDPGTMELRLSQRTFIETLGTAPAGLSHQDMKSYVCAQCHGARDGSLTLEGFIERAEKSGEADWNHAGSGVPLVKVRHPEFELWSLGVHARHGVSCADCHMPYQPEGSVRITSHRMKSPLLDLSSSCTACHRGREKELQGKVEAIQDATMDLQRRASEVLLSAHGALGAARRTGVPEARLGPARDLVRRAQLHWDAIASERSTGFHAPQAAAEQLGIAIDLARQAEIQARQLQRDR